MQITAADFARIRVALGRQAEDDIEWSEYECVVPASPDDFAAEAVFVICNSGMRYTVARGIFERCMEALRAGRPVAEVFRHQGKVGAIEHIWANRAALHEQLADAAAAGDEALLAFCESLPWIGSITKYHLAKNFGLNAAKPDVHLQRLADREGCSAQALCERLAREVGLRAATVDVVLWRACASGVLNSRTGEIA